MSEKPCRRDSDVVMETSLVPYCMATIRKHQSQRPDKADKSLLINLLRAKHVTLKKKHFNFNPIN